MTMTEQALEKVHLRGRAPQIVPSFSGSEPELDAEKLGVASDLRDFVKGFTARTFQSFPIQGSQDGPQVSGVPPMASKVRQDLNEWQAKHATLFLTTVKVSASSAGFGFIFSGRSCDSDGGPDDGEVSFSDDFDKIDNLEDADEEGHETRMMGISYKLERVSRTMK
ncbi:hypothetical protein SAY86_009147 [Trapa natans]|uniref:Uncharacterized protein n=1 Tax=Trapa natans TaxID=22666 RepID=A0AAN7KE29_TRANT|nr:hypothetical protein SAY86_009147 [Trapa natans]